MTDEIKKEEHSEPGHPTPPHEEQVPEQSNKGVGWGYIIFFAVVLAVAGFGFKDKILSYFNGTKDTVVQESADSKSHEDTMSSSEDTGASIGGASEDADDTTNGKSGKHYVTPEMVNQLMKEYIASNPDAMKDVMKEYILNNPEVIMESLTKLEQKNNEQKEKEAKEYVNKDYENISSDKPYMGNKNGQVVMVKFFDYRCGYCKKVSPTIEKLVKEFPNLKVSLVELPLGAPSAKAAKIALAVNELYPNKFHWFHKDLINAREINDATILGLVTKYKFDKAKLMEMADSERISNVLKSNIQVAQRSGVRGVPAFIINGEFISGAMDYDELKKKIIAAGDAVKKTAATAK